MRWLVTLSRGDVRWFATELEAQYYAQLARDILGTWGIRATVSFH